MASMMQWWRSAQPGARWGLAAGGAAIVAVTAAFGWWALRPDYAVLFTEVAASDAALMVAELDKMKQPYRLGGDGGTILVPAESVHKTRLKLAGKDLPLHGTVGLELFNGTEIGMTDFAQKVNYQRAQQGELTRTILSIEEVQSARVHLAVAEQGLFKKPGAHAKASVTLATKPGRVLQPNQVRGIQRLVAAAVPDVRPDDVTILDQHGVALTSAAGEADASAGDALEGKRNLERYLSGKAALVLDQTFGAGRALASVDVVLDQEQVRTTTEQVLPAVEGSKDSPPSGLVLREKQSSQEPPASADPAKGVERALISSETEYQIGRRVQQTVSLPGAIRRLNVAVVVRSALSAEQGARLREVVAAAVGLDPARGDAIAVYAADQLASLATPVAAEPPAAAAAVAVPAQVPLGPAMGPGWLGLLGLTLALGAGIGAILVRLRAAAPPALTAQEREALLLQLDRLSAPEPVGGQP